MSTPLQRVGARDPQRCAHMSGCHYRRVEGSETCPLHGGSQGGLVHAKKQTRNLILQGEMGRRAEEMHSTGRLKDLTCEVILARVVLEGLAKNIQGPSDYLIYSDKLNNTLKTIQSLVESTQKLEERNKELIDRPTIMAIAEAILGVITENVSDPDQQVKIGQEIFDVITRGLGS